MKRPTRLWCVKHSTRISRSGGMRWAVWSGSILVPSIGRMNARNNVALHRNKKMLIQLLLLTLLQDSTKVESGEVSGKVAGIADGDTITILTAEKK